MARNQWDYGYDAEVVLKDAGLVGASAAAQVSGVDRVLTLGDARMDATVIVDTTAVEVASGNEKYDIIWQCSDSATFASGVVSGPRLVLGDSSVTGDSADHAAAGRYEMGVTNNINGTIYAYGRLYTGVTGTVATGINYVARLVK